MDSHEYENGIPDSLVDEEIHIIEQPVHQTVGRKKKGNFTPDEDIILVSAWLNTSMDAINGNEQKSKTFWSRIATLYNENVGINHPKRSTISITNRWHALQEKVNKFQGCFAQIETRNSSGTTEKDMINEAKLLYQSLHGGNFAFEHCWNILRTKPKWMTRNSISSKKRMYLSCSSGIRDSIDLENNSTLDKPFGFIERPLGRKAEKEAMKKKKGGDILEDWKEYKMNIQENKLKMQEEKMKIFSIESEKNAKIEQDKIDLENKKLEFEAKKFLIESENNAKIEKDKIDLENKRLEFEAKRFSIDSENNAKIEKEKIDAKNKEIELDAKKFRHQQMQQEMNIVLMDTSTLDAKQKYFIEARRAEILAREFD